MEKSLEAFGIPHIAASSEGDKRVQGLRHLARIIAKAHLNKIRAEARNENDHKKEN